MVSTRYAAKKLGAGQADVSAGQLILQRLNVPLTSVSSPILSPSGVVIVLSNSCVGYETRGDCLERLIKSPSRINGTLEIELVQKFWGMNMQNIATKSCASACLMV